MNKRDKTPTKLGKFIRERREKLKLTRKEFVSQMPDENKIGTDTLSKIESGIIKKPPERRLQAFSEILDIDIRVLRNLLLTVMITLTSLMQAEQKSIEFIKAFEPVEGYHIAFSGGKDSIVIKELAKRANVRFTINMALTTVDPPELLKFNKKHHPDLIYHVPKKSMFKLIRDKHSLPTRLSRFCCEGLKEYVGTGEGKLIMQGIRADESKSRSKRRFYEVDDRKSQLGKEYLNPILEWTDEFLWKYIRANNIPYCELYDEGFKRLGCVGCPLGTSKNMAKELDRWPTIKNSYLKAIKGARKGTNNKGKAYAINANFNSENDAIDWWISQKSTKKYILLKKQLKLDFKNKE